MPPKRVRPAPPPAPKTPNTKRTPTSKLAKEFGLSAQDETEIKEAFEFFAYGDQGSDMEDDENEDEDEEEVVASGRRRKVTATTSKRQGKQKKSEGEKVLPTDELRNALKYVCGRPCISGLIGARYGKMV